MRRSYQQAKNGQPYCIEWPEWHVDCAFAGCECDELMANLGEAHTIKEAEARFKADGTKGWTKSGGVWFCPTHSNETEVAKA